MDERLPAGERLQAALDESLPVVRMDQVGDASRVGVKVSGVTPNTS